MHARCQREIVEKKRKGVPNGAANSVKVTGTANTVDSLAVQVECLGGVRRTSGLVPMSGYEQNAYGAGKRASFERGA